jgi:hypothetical protein
MVGISSRISVIFGCVVISLVIRAANSTRSTASADPAGTRQVSATRTTSEPTRRISSLRIPAALVISEEPSEFEQTSSASWSVLCAAVGRVGRISYSATATPRSAACHAASQPANPPPRTVNSGVVCAIAERFPAE